ncbi:hypothetical protein [Burkholderia stagnalis]|uniref:hypothetical protein n=1 Tax=Burkholderia stagnalis TaxID=1503054 RepID=UPI000B03A791|nr:hypothetical protein [Burkholderia stagnalis]
MTFEPKHIELRRIYLDNANPRHDPIDNESDIVAHLIAYEKVKALASDIAEKGTSPLERLAVVPHDLARNSYVAVEGNRRLCALKLLADPEKAPEPHRGFFRALSKKASLPEKIEVVAFKDRESARQWIELRHEGALDGVGTRPWNPAQKARFNAQGSPSSNPNAQALLMLDYAVRRGLISPDERATISLTTLTRFLSNPVFRNVLGLASAKDLSVVVPQDEFDRGIEKFLRDAMGGKDAGVHSRTNKEEREAYGRKLQKQGVAPTSRLAEPVEFPVKQQSKPLDASRPGNQTSSSPRRDNQSPDVRTTVIPTKFKARISDKILKRLYDELKTLDSETYSFSCAYLLRAVVEQSAKLFLKKRGKGNVGDLHILIGRVADELQQDGISAPQLKYLRVMANDRDSRASPETLGAFVHGGQIPTSVELAKAWDNLSDILTVIFAELEQTN